LSLRLKVMNSLRCVNYSLSDQISVHYESITSPFFQMGTHNGLIMDEAAYFFVKNKGEIQQHGYDFLDENQTFKGVPPSLNPPRLNAAPSSDSPGPVRRLRRLTTPLRRCTINPFCFRRVVSRLRLDGGALPPLRKSSVGGLKNAWAFCYLWLPHGTFFWTKNANPCL